MIPILLLIQLTSGCVFTYVERSNQLTEQCRMQAMREYLSAVAFLVKTENCTANLQPLTAGPTPVVQFEVCKVDEDAPTVTLCASRHIDQEWRLHATCKVY